MKKILIIFTYISYGFAFLSCRPKRLLHIHHEGNLLEKDSSKSIFIFGLGYVGSRLASSLLQRGWKVSGTCTTVSRMKIFTDEGINTFIFDDEIGPIVQPDALKELMSCSHIISTIPPTDVTDDLR